MSFTTTIKNHLTKIKMRLMSTYQSDTPSNKLIAWMNKPDSVELSKYWTNKILDINDVMTGDNPRSISLNWMGLDSEKLFDSIDQQEFFNEYYDFWQRLVPDHEKEELFTFFKSDVAL